MYALKAENRERSLKSKQLRRQGLVPGVLYGKNLEESINIQFPLKEITRFLRTNSAGSKVQLEVGDKKFSTLCREISYRPSTGEIEHLSFQTLLADEVITSTMRVVLLNREKISGLIMQQIDEISYKSLPAYITDTVEIDLEGLKVGDSIKISDLDIAKNPNIEILHPLDTVVLTINEARKTPDTNVENTEEQSEE